MTIPGVGDSASKTSAAPVPFSTIFAAASRSVCDGPTVSDTSDIPSLTCICVLLSHAFEISADRMQEYPNRRPEQRRFRGAPTYRLRPASAVCAAASKLIRPLLALSPSRRADRGRIGLRHDERRYRARARPLHSEMRHLPRAGAGRNDGPDRPQPRRRLRRRPGNRARTARRSKASSRPRSSRRGPSPATRRSRCRPTSSPARTSTTSPPTSACTPGCPAPRRPRCPAAPAPRSSPTKAAAGATLSPRQKPAARPARTSTKSCPAEHSPTRSKRTIVDPNKEIAKGYPPNVMPPNFEQTLSPKELEDLVQYLFENTPAGKGSKGG